MSGTPRLAGAEHRLIRTGEVSLHVVEVGRGPVVVLLHGFPEFWWCWRHQLPALAAAGYRAVAVDLRGYGGSDRPPDVAAYSVARLADDVAGLLDALGVERAAAVVGHDWGGVVGYRFAARHADRLERLAILSSPHPATFARGLLREWQALRSAYMLALLVPGVAERAFAARNGALLRRTLRAFRSTPVPDAELDPYVEAAKGAEWLRGGLGVYRAMAQALASRARSAVSIGAPSRQRASALRERPHRRIDSPVLVIWGDADPFLAPHLAEPPRDAVPNVRVEHLPGASHDVMLDAPERVNALLVDFLALALAQR